MHDEHTCMYGATPMTAELTCTSLSGSSLRYHGMKRKTTRKNKDKDISCKLIRGEWGFRVLLLDSCSSVLVWRREGHSECINSGLI